MRLPDRMYKWLGTRLGPFAFVAVAALATGCATSDQAKLKESRAAYLRDDFSEAEKALYSSEVYQNDQNRLLHYYLLASIAMSQGEYEKTVYLLEKARSTAISVRSESGLFEMFSTTYKSNPVEYSSLHAMLVLAYSMMAADGKSKAWSTPEIRDKKGNILVQAISVSEHVYTPKDIADYKQKARAELMAWDTFLEGLKQSHPERDFYHEDLWARILASFIHGLSDNNNEKRTAELLAGEAAEILQRTAKDLPSRNFQSKEIGELISRLKTRAQSKDDKASLVVLEAGVMSRYKIRRYHLGLSTLFKHIQDPYLRSQMEQIGLQVILNEAPEFGLVLFTGAIAGAASGGNEDDEEYDGPPRFFSDAVDRSFGFQIQFPSLQAPPADTQVHLLLSKGGTLLPEVRMPIVSPLQETLSVELQKRQDKEMFERAIRIGLQYLGVLIPAIRSYRQAQAENNLFKKIAVLAGYYLAKKVIDAANTPDLRSWNTLPKLIAAQVPAVAPGTYDAKVVIDNGFGRYETALGALELGNPARPILRSRIGNVDILNRRPVDPKPVP